MQVWLIPLRLAPGHAAAAMRLLDEAERARAKRFRFDLDRDRYVAAHAALRLVLAPVVGKLPQALRFSAGLAGKPQLDGACAITPQFNLSHSGDWAAIAISQDGPVGIDIEQLDHAQERAPDIASAFTEQERQAIDALAPHERALATYRCWVRKEALLKAAGVGLAGGLDRVAVSVGASGQLLSSQHPAIEAHAWSLASIDVPGRWAGAVAAKGPMPFFSPRHWHWSL